MLRVSVLRWLHLVLWLSPTITGQHPSLLVDSDGTEIIDRLGSQRLFTVARHPAERLTADQAAQLHKHTLIWGRSRVPCPVEISEGRAGISVCVDPQGDGLPQLLPLGQLLHTELFQLTINGYCGIDPADLNRVTSTGSYCSAGMDNGDAADLGLSAGLAILFEKSSVLDMGAGYGQYLRCLRHNASVSRTEGYDGQHGIAALSGGWVTQLDLSKPVVLGEFNWVMSIEVGEHIPHQFENSFILNLVTHAAKGLVLSWAHVGQWGIGHINCRNAD